MSATAFFCLQFALSLVLAPLLPGLITRVKAWAAGRHGKPLLQIYFDLWKLARKGEVLNLGSGWPFALGPSAVLASCILALALAPLGGTASPLAFTGDFILAAYLLGVGRFAMLLAALDTGSSFEGMGASREAAFSAISEPAIFLGFLVLASVCLDCGDAAQPGGGLSLASMFHGQGALAWQLGKPALLVMPVVFFMLLLAENCRIPVDDPTTHLELTMIHEAMILDQSGPNLALLTYAASLKLWFFAALVAALLTPPCPSGRRPPCGWRWCCWWACWWALWSRLWPGCACRECPTCWAWPRPWPGLR